MKKKIGELIKSRFDASGMEVTLFAKLLGRDRSTVYDIFLRDSIDTKLLEKIGQVLKYDFYQDLIQPETKREMLLREAVTNKIYVELTLSSEEVEKLGIKDKVISELK